MNFTELLKNPALLVGFVRAAMLVAVSFGVAFTQTQQDSVTTLVGAAIAVVASLVLTGVTVSRTTPTANPSIPEGTTVTVITPEGQPNTSIVV
jgi:uncharacterized membrane protein